MCELNVNGEVVSAREGCCYGSPQIMRVYAKTTSSFSVTADILEAMMLPQRKRASQSFEHQRRRVKNLKVETWSFRLSRSSALRPTLFENRSLFKRLCYVYPRTEIESRPVE